MSTSISDVVQRFAGKQFVLYGGSEELLKTVQEAGDVMLWYKDAAPDAASQPPVERYSKLYSPIWDAVYVIVTTGYMGGKKVEAGITDILYAPDNQQKIVILHGYPNYISTGSPLSVERYNGGTVVGLAEPKHEMLSSLAQALGLPTSIPVPLTNISQVPQVDELLPYIHLYSRIAELGGEIPSTDNLPVDVMDIADPETQTEYKPGERTSAINWGQRKLLVAEIELLVEVYKRLPEGEGPIVVYVGSAPGSHIPRLVDLFAAMDVPPVFHLWDRKYLTEGRNNFDIKDEGLTNIEIVPAEYIPPNYEEELEPFIPANMRDRPRDEQIRSVYGFFTDGVVEMYKRLHPGQNNLVFVSDIRDASSEEAVLRDMRLQENWVRELNPFASHLKFRLPFRMQETYDYLDGDILTQAWARNKSSETRLLSFRPYTTRRYNVIDYESSMAYFNTVTRVQSYDQGKAVKALIPDTNLPRHISVPEVGLCTCHDCTREVQIMAKYFQQLKDIGLLETVTEEDFVREVILNTEFSRPSDERQTNPRTLWSTVSIKMPPFDRKHMVLFEELPEDTDEYEKSLNRLWQQAIAERGDITERNEIQISTKDMNGLNIPALSTILLYGDGYSQQQIVDLLASKVPQKPRILCGPDASPDCNVDTNPVGLLRQILMGEKLTILVNFHTDIGKYDPARDTGPAGAKRFQTFLRQMAIAEQTQQMPGASTLQQLAIHLLSAFFRK